MRPGPTPRAQGAPDTPLMRATERLHQERRLVLGIGGREARAWESGGGECCSRVSWETSLCPEAV